MPRKQKRESRSQRRDALLRDAARVAIPERVDVCVVGGGAAGLVAGIAAAEKGARVVVLERDLECGRTILATGNGRCNFANRQLDPTRYNDPAFVAAVCGPTWLDDVLEFFRSCGLAWAEEGEGRLYPLSRQAASVRNVLLERARRAGVVLAPAREVWDVRHVVGDFMVRYTERFGQERQDALGVRGVIVSTGGGAQHAAANVGLFAGDTQPILCPLVCVGMDLSALDGRRVHARLSLERAERVVATENGEVLFRDYGISGIAAFNLSRHAQAGDELVLDLLPGLDAQTTATLAANTLDGLLDPVIAAFLLSECKSTAQAVARAKALRLTVSGPAETERAQVTRGGYATSAFDPTTLEAYGMPRLFACGEALDIDGPCGGFNLAWAWKSGMVAGATAGTVCRA
ncbi:MAG: aminoacetone oxidase family FAD-binding enzyme [Coriobacteriales bacterium]|nr:aminoacetone oxidase family FAD-binding enzyme [Coriobacteriales bacterium]